MDLKLTIVSKTCGGSVEKGNELISNLPVNREIKDLLLSDWYCLNHNPISFKKITIYFAEDVHWKIVNVSQNIFSHEFFLFNGVKKDNMIF